ncbi:MAG: nucleotidyltransferase domain-containing protein [Spirochaetes bacterium]|nr:MAG: nucleotidyltransferase domain-containing protein [Spirochaetota bacterium]
MKTENIPEAVEELKTALVGKFGNGITLILFGSAARGTCGSDSDVDILVLIPGMVGIRLEEEVIETAYEIELRHDVVFGIIVYPENSGIPDSPPSCRFM